MKIAKIVVVVVAAVGIFGLAVAKTPMGQKPNK
jgi:hypothetical protein